jgi:uridylate kinase
VFEEGGSIDAKILKRLATEIKELCDALFEVGLVIGGGNILRGAQKASEGLDRVTSDHMGMLATVINAMAMQDALECIDQPVRVMSALQINQVCEDYIRRRAVRHLEKGRVAIFAAGMGNPFFTTDSAASLRAVEINADLLIKATKVEGVYSADPAQHSDAKFIDSLSFDDAITKNLKVMDATALTLARDHGLPINVFNVGKQNALKDIISGKKIGTLIS